MEKERREVKREKRREREREEYKGSESKVEEGEVVIMYKYLGLVVRVGGGTEENVLHK